MPDHVAKHRFQYRYYAGILIADAERITKAFESQGLRAKRTGEQILLKSLTPTLAYYIKDDGIH